MLGIYDWNSKTRTVKSRIPVAARLNSLLKPQREMAYEQLVRLFRKLVICRWYHLSAGMCKVKIPESQPWLFIKWQIPVICNASSIYGTVRSYLSSCPIFFLLVRNSTSMTLTRIMTIPANCMGVTFSCPKYTPRTTATTGLT